MKPPKRSLRRPQVHSGWHRRHLGPARPVNGASISSRQGTCRHGGRRRGEPHTAAARSIEELAASTQTELGRRKGGKGGEAALPRVLGKTPRSRSKVFGNPRERGRVEREGSRRRQGARWRRGSRQHQPWPKKTGGGERQRRPKPNSQQCNYQKLVPFTSSSPPPFIGSEQTFYIPKLTLCETNQTRMF
jgi:hypothetical protein